MIRVLRGVWILRNLSGLLFLLVLIMLKMTWRVLVVGGLSCRLVVIWLVIRRCCLLLLIVGVVLVMVVFLIGRRRLRVLVLMILRFVVMVMRVRFCVIGLMLSMSCCGLGMRSLSLTFVFLRRVLMVGFVRLGLRCVGLFLSDRVLVLNRVLLIVWIGRLGVVDWRLVSLSVIRRVRCLGLIGLLLLIMSLV